MYICSANIADLPCRQAWFSLSPGEGTVGFHNYNLRIFNLRVSNPKFS